MNAEPKKTDRPSFRAALKQAPGRFLRACLHNWGWKLLSLFLAICLWVGLITQDPTLTREYTFNAVPVTVTGADSLIRNGMVVLSGLDEEGLTVRLRAEVPQRTYSTALASNYNPRVDVSRITETGEQTLRIQATSSTTYGTVDAIIPDSVTVVVDHYVTNYRIPVSLNIIGAYPAGYYGSNPLLDPSSVAVSGPQSIVDQVANLYVDYDVSRLAAHEGQVRTALPIRFTDVNGNNLDGSQLSVTSASVVLRTITVEQRLYPTKTLSIADMALTVGDPAAGYELKSITASPSSILAAGDPNALTALDTLFTESPVDITDKSESFTVEIDLRKPNSLHYLSETAVTLKIEIAPVMTTKTFEDIKVGIHNADEQLQAGLSADRVTVAVTGPENTIDALNASALTAFLDTRGLAAGEHMLPVMIDADIEGIDDLSYDITPASLSIVLTKKES